MMKCKICGKRCNSLKAMASHYRKKHPSKMKAKKPKQSRQSAASAGGMRYCPCCGREL